MLKTVIGKHKTIYEWLLWIDSGYSAFSPHTIATGIILWELMAGFISKLVAACNRDENRACSDSASGNRRTLDHAYNLIPVCGIGAGKTYPASDHRSHPSGQSEFIAIPNYNPESFSMMPSALLGRAHK
ncbi:MAG: hypothetical protein M0Q44_09570 [Methylobacter sp.]|nr:hypothetical protein [Methylobacter sp.]